MPRCARGVRCKADGRSVCRRGGVPRVLAFLNRKNGTEWERVDVVNMERSVGGDYLTVGKFNDDKIPDFAASSVFFHAGRCMQRARYATTLAYGFSSS